MRHGWEIKKLGEVCKLFTDGDWIESKDQSYKGIRLIQTGNIGCGEFNDKADHYRYISEETFIRLNCTEIYAGDILISRLPDPIGRSCIIPRMPHRMITAVDCTIVRPENIINPNFLVYYTNSRPYQDEINRYVTGAVRKRISRKNLFKIPIPVPPLSEQERIVVELDLLNDVIAKKREQLKQLDALAQSIFYDMFGDPITNEKGWETKKLGDVFQTTSGGTPAKGHNEYYDNGTIPWLRSGEINKMYIYDTELYITELGLHNSSAKWFPTNTVVIAMYGATVGQVGILCKEMTTNQAVCGIFPNDEFIPIYIYHFLLSKKNEYIEIAAGGAQPNISQNIVRNTLISCPPLSLQQQFASKIESIEKQKELIKQSLSEVQQLFDSRMDYYFG